MKREMKQVAVVAQEGAVFIKQFPDDVESDEAVVIVQPEQVELLVCWLRLSELEARQQGGAGGD